MDFDKAVQILTEKMNQYKSYRQEHPEFTNPPAFVLALGTGSGPNYLNQVIDCMLGGVQTTDGSFALEQYTPDRFRQKCVWFCIAMDDVYSERDLFLKQYISIIRKTNTSDYKVDIQSQMDTIQTQYENGEDIIHRMKQSNSFKQSLLGSLQTKKETAIEALLNSVQEPFTLAPVSYQYNRNDNGEYIFTDRNTFITGTPAHMPVYPGGLEAYQSQTKPNFYNLITVPQNYKQTSLNDLSRTKHIALRKFPLGTTEPMKNIVIGTNCTLDKSPMLKLQSLCEEIFAMGGFCFVYNDAFFHEKGTRYNKNRQENVPYHYLANYYFEDMCDIPMFFQQFPSDRVFRIGGRADRNVTPLFESIPLDTPLKKFNSGYHSHRGGRRSNTKRLRSVRTIQRNNRTNRTTKKRNN